MSNGLERELKFKIEDLKKRVNILRGQGSKLHQNKAVNPCLAILSEKINKESVGFINQLATLTRYIGGEYGDMAGNFEARALPDLSLNEGFFSAIFDIVKSATHGVFESSLVAEEARKEVKKQLSSLEPKVLVLEQEMLAVKRDYGASIGLY